MFLSTSNQSNVIVLLDLGIIPTLTLKLVTKWLIVCLADLFSQQWIHPGFSMNINYVCLLSLL